MPKTKNQKLIAKAKARKRRNRIKELVESYNFIQAEERRLKEEVSDD